MFIFIHDYKSRTSRTYKFIWAIQTIAIIQLRKSGKTTLVKLVFPDKPYVNLENPDMRNLALVDLKALLGQFSNGASLNEEQRTPELFSCL